MGVPEQGYDGRTFGRYLRSVRTSRNLSLDTVEEMTHSYPEPVTKSHLSRIENGRAAPSFARMYALSQVYGIPISRMAERFELDLHKSMREEEPDLLTPEKLPKTLAALYESGDMIRGLVICTTAIENFCGGESTDGELLLQLRYRKLVFLAKMERYESAKIEAEELLSDIGDDATPSWRFKVLCTFVQCCYHLGRYSIARMGLETLGQQLESVPRSLEPYFLDLRASVALKTGDLKSAATDFLAASRKFEELSDPYSACTSSLNLAQTYIDMGKTREPVKILRQAGRICEQHGFQRQHALALSHLCVVSYLSNDYSNAESYALRSNSMARPREFMSIVFRNCYYLRNIARSRGDDRGVRSNERSMKALVNRVDQEIDVVQAFRRETEGESR